MRLVADLRRYPRSPGAKFLGAERVVEAEHPLEVLGRLELRREPGAAHQLGR